MSTQTKLRLIYCAISGLAAFISHFDGITPEQLASMNWMQWLVVAAKVLVAVLITDKALLENSNPSSNTSAR